jgi:hypothetical protein
MDKSNFDKGRVYIVSSRLGNPSWMKSLIMSTMLCFNILSKPQSLYWTASQEVHK